MKFLDLTGLQHFYDKYLRPLKDAAFKNTANNLTTETEGSVLDARQGKVLNDLKLSIAKVINNLLTTEEGFALDARQGKVLDDKITELNGNLSFLKHKTVKNGSYEFDCYTYILDGKKMATIHGSWTGMSSQSSIVGGFSVYTISNLQLSPDDAELDILKHVSVDFNPGTGGGGTLFIGNYEEFSTTIGLNGHYSQVKALYCIVTSPPRTVKITWTLKCELYS